MSKYTKCNSICFDDKTMASRFTILKGRVRLCRTRLGSIFLFLLGVACVLCVLNWISNSYARREISVLDYDSTGRHLAGLPGGQHVMATYHGHRKRKRPFAVSEDEQVCKVPKLSLQTDTNRHAYFDVGNLTCSDQELFYLVNSTLRINKTTLGRAELTHCVYRGIDRISDVYHIYSSPLKKTDNFEVKIKNDFFRIQCYTKNSAKRENVMMGGMFADYQRRRLLQVDNRNVANSNLDVGRSHMGNSGPGSHSPQLYGSMGLPDLPHSMLGQDKHGQEARLNGMNIKQQQAKENLPSDKVTNVQQRTQNQKNTSNVQLNEHIQQHSVQQEEQRTKGDLKKAVQNEIDLNKNQNDIPEEMEFHPNDDYMDNPVNDYDWDMYIPDFDQLFAQVYPKQDVLNRVGRCRPFQNSTQMNVLMFALDSMSHLSYQRKLPKTYAYLKDTLKAVILDAYNIVGDATTAAIIPIFTGQTEMELPETRVNKEGTHYVDIYPFIWNKFEQSGYVTLYAEDQPSLGTFQLRLNGFEEAPVDHYMRPFWQAASESEVHQNSQRFCLGGKPEHQYMLDYLKDLFIKYPNVPKFAFGFLGELSHDDNNPAQYIDNDLRDFLEYLKSNGHLENTLLIVMGDHGARYSQVRYTTQGKLEERLPMMSLTFPEKFTRKYPHLIRNLETNKDRLSTPFDLHETLKTVLDIYNAEKPIKYTDRGISLLNSIPANRTCRSAGVALHWCTCMYYEYLDITDMKVKAIAEFVVSHINKKTQHVRNMCVELQLKQIYEARIAFPNEMVLKYLRSKDSDQRIANFSKTIKLDVLHYQLTVQTLPNDGLYEATIQAVVADGSFNIVGDISRINRYGTQPHCILEKQPDLRKYCFCHKEPTPPPKKGHRKMRKARMNL